jgi:hypothetical protein
MVVVFITRLRDSTLIMWHWLQMRRDVVRSAGWQLGNGRGGDVSHAVAATTPSRRLHDIIIIIMCTLRTPGPGSRTSCRCGTDCYCCSSYDVGPE